MDWFEAKGYSVRTAEVYQRLKEKRLIWDISSAAELDTLRRDVRRISADMDDPDPSHPPPMFWSGIPWPEVGASPRCDYQLVISVGGTKTEFALMRLDNGQVFALDPRTGREVSDPEEIDRIKTKTQLPTPKYSPEVPSGEKLVATLVAHFKKHYGSRREALERCQAIFMSWGFPHRVIRTGPRLAGGLSAKVTLMTKDQAGFTESLLGKEINSLFDREFHAQLDWSRPIAVANDTVMALYYFLDPDRRRGVARAGLFINGTGTNFSSAEPYAIRKESFISQGKEDYVPDRITASRPLGKKEEERLFFVNYEAGSIRLETTMVKEFDTDPEYPIERNVLAGGNAFPQQFERFTKEFVSEKVYQTIRGNWITLQRQRGKKHIEDRPEALVVSILAGEADAANLLRGIPPDGAVEVQLRLISRAIIARSALHAAMVLAAVTRRTGFGKGAGGLPDLLGMEGSVWKTIGYQDLVKSYWQDLIGKDPLNVNFSAESSYNASLSGPLYLAAIHGRE